MPVTPKKRVITKLVLDEISCVDAPAHEPALFTILKSDSKEMDVEKYSGRAAMTGTDPDGSHVHILMLDDWDGESVTAGYTSEAPEEYGYHRHPFIIDEAGNITIGVSCYHTHDIAMLSNTAKAAIQFLKNKSGKRKEVQPMDEAAVKRLNAIIALNAEERAYFDTLSKTADQDSWLAMTSDARQTILVAKRGPVADPEEVLYRTADNLEIRRKDGETALRLAKERDTELTKRLEMEAKAAEAALEKRAEELFADAPGEAKHKIILTKALDSMSEEDKAGVLRIIRAKNVTGVDPEKHLGTTTKGNSDSKTTREAAADALDKMAKARAAETKTNYSDAYKSVLATAEGAELYRQYLGQ